MLERFSNQSKTDDQRKNEEMKIKINFHLNQQNI